MIKTVREIEAFGNKIYVRHGLDTDVTELLADYKNAIGASSKNKKYRTGDSFIAVNTSAEYEFEEGSNTWYLQA